MTNSPGEAADELKDHDWFEKLVSFGLVCLGVVHLVIAWLAVKLALDGQGDSGQASQQGALHTLAKQPFGSVLLWVCAVGFAILTLWQVLEAWRGPTWLPVHKRRMERVASGFRVPIYAYLALLAAKTVLGSPTSGNTKQTTSSVLSQRWGVVIVAVVGLVIVGVGIGHVVIGWRRLFADHLDTDGLRGFRGKAFLRIGTAGYVSKGIAFAVVGCLFVWAALTDDAKKSGGLDQALQRVQELPFGKVLLVLIALGIACFGVFCFARAAYGAHDD